MQYYINIMSKMFKDKNMQIQCDVHMPNKVLYNWHYLTLANPDSKIFDKEMLG